MSIWDFPTKPPPYSGTCRMFQSDLIERFSRIHPATPFVAWIPVIAVVLTRSALRHDIAWWGALGMFAGGVLAWTFSEYVLHRWVFHWIEDSPRGRRLHFLIHGVHHDFPSDKDRLVMPLGFSIPLGVIFYLAYFLDDRRRAWASRSSPASCSATSDTTAATTRFTTSGCTRASCA